MLIEQNNENLLGKMLDIVHVNTFNAYIHSLIEKKQVHYRQYLMQASLYYT